MRVSVWEDRERVIKEARDREYPITLDIPYSELAEIYDIPSNTRGKSFSSRFVRRVVSGTGEVYIVFGSNKEGRTVAYVPERLDRILALDLINESIAASRSRTD